MISWCLLIVWVIMVTIVAVAVAVVAVVAVVAGVVLMLIRRQTVKAQTSHAHMSGVVVVHVLLNDI